VFGCLNKQADVFLHDWADAMWNFKRLEDPPFFFLSWLLFSIKDSQLNYKDANILHIKLGGSGKSNHFSTFTPSKRTPHHHG